MPNFTMTATTLTFPDGTTMTTAAQSIPTGTVTNFFQASAPTGWTKLTTNDNAAIRIVSGTGGGTGGSVNFNTAFASQAVNGTVSVSGGSVSSYTLAANEMPSHNHGMGARYAGYGPYNGVHSNWLGNDGTGYFFSTGGSGAHGHGFSNPSASFSGTAINMAVKYLDNIMCSKD